MIVVNGKVYDGGSVSVINNTVIVDGVVVDGPAKQKVQIIIQPGGALNLVKSDLDVFVSGNVNGNVEAVGSVTCSNVTGSVKAGGSVNCDDVDGDVSAGGSVNCDDVGGNVSARGSIFRG